ncbi:MAG TPA: hypothetical protein VGO86_11005 [Candidatus Dormibacteraeota bacterium]
MTVERGRGPLVLVAAIAALVVVAAAGLGLRAWYEQQPPALDESGAGTVLRLTGESGGMPAARVRVQFSNGLPAFVSMAGITTQQGHIAGRVTVAPSRGPERVLTLAQGQSAEAGGLQVTMLHVWRMPDATNNAIDVRVEQRR